MMKILFVNSYAPRMLKNCTIWDQLIEKVNLYFKIGLYITNLKYCIKVYQRNLESDILNNKDGDKNNLYYSLASGNRNDNNGYDIETCRKDAKALFNACQGKLNEKVFIEIITSVSFPQLYSTFACFSEIAKENIESVIKKHTNGNLQKTCLTMSNILYLLYV